MTYPRKRAQLATARFYWQSNGNCGRCGAAIRWYRTPGGTLPLNPMPHDDSEVVNHSRVCERKGNR